MFQLRAIRVIESRPKTFLRPTQYLYREYSRENRHLYNQIIFYSVINHSAEQHKHQEYLGQSRDHRMLQMHNFKIMNKTELKLWAIAWNNLWESKHFYSRPSNTKPFSLQTKRNTIERSGIIRSKQKPRMPQTNSFTVMVKTKPKLWAIAWNRLCKSQHLRIRLISVDPFRNFWDLLFRNIHQVLSS